MLKLIKQYAHKIKNREYYNELYVVPFPLLFSEFERIVEEAIEDIIFNMEKYLNEVDEFKLSYSFKINVMIVDNLNDIHNLEVDVMIHSSLVSYYDNSKNLKYLFNHKATNENGPIKIDITDTYPENSLIVKNVEESHSLNDFFEQFIYTEYTDTNENYQMFRLYKHSIKFCLAWIIYARRLLI